MLDRSDFHVMTDDGPKPVGELCGWAGTDKELLRTAFDAFGSQFKPLDIKGAMPTANARSMLWEVARKVIGGDTPNYAQQVGDCVSFGYKNASEYVQMYPIAAGERDVWTRIFPPYLYGCGRVLIGGGMWGDGSLGSWQSAAIMKYGVIPIDAPGCPQYSGSLARSWGRSGPPQSFVDIGKTHVVKSAALVTTWEQAVQALTNGYPVTLCSDVGYDMTVRSDGFQHYSTSWGHCMCIIGVDEGDGGNIEPHACILNSWGDVHGQIKDFRTGENWPVGTIRARKKDIVTALQQGDSYSVSSLDGFPAQPLPRDIFDAL